jgi:hypothetical protein
MVERGELYVEDGESRMEDGAGASVARASIIDPVTLEPEDRGWKMEDGGGRRVSLFDPPSSVFERGW